MANTLELRELEHAHWELVLIIEGIPFFWATNAYLAALDFCGDGRSGQVGLDWPRWTLEIGLVDGQFRDHQTTFNILDIRTRGPGGTRGYLAELLAVRDPSEEVLLTSFGPRDPAPASTWDRHVGIEAIGPAGERGRYPVIPGAPRPLEHVGQDFGSPEHVIATVSDEPLLMVGRRVALYQVYRDHISYPDDRSQGWRPWSEAQLRWVGSLLDAGDVQGGKWSLRCAGLPKLLDRDLGGLSQSEPTPLRVPIQLGPDERQAAVRFHRYSADGSGLNGREYGYATFGQSVGAWSGSFAADYPSAGALIADFQTLLLTLAAEPNPVNADGSFLGEAGNQFEVLPDGGVRIRVSAGAVVYLAMVEACLHEKVWRAMGYDPPNQRDLPTDDPGHVIFRDVDLFPNWALAGLHLYATMDTVNAPPGFWSAYFCTAPLEEGIGIFGNVGWPRFHNDGASRFWAPLYPGGAAALPADLGSGTELIVGNLDGQLWHTGQLDRAPASDPSSPTDPYPLTADVDTQGLWLVQGPRRFAGEDDIETEMQIARGSWRRNGYAGIDSPDGEPNVVLTQWLSPEAFGIPRKLISSDWAILQNVPLEQSVTATPMLVLSARNGANRPDEMVLRLLLTSGTSDGWDSYHNDATAQLDPGDNDLALGGVVLDGEIADLGLAFPRELVHDPTEFQALYEALPPGSYRGWALAFLPPARTADIFAGLFQALGWCWHFRGGRLGIFSPSDILTPDDADIVITHTERRGSLRKPDGRTRQDLRAYAPIDEFTLDYDWNPIDRSHNDQEVIKSPDKGARYRPRSAPRQAGPMSIRSPNSWELRAKEIADFWERRHFMLRNYPIKGRRPGQDVWPGTRVLITEPGAVGQDGRYGVTLHMGVVTKVTHDTSAGRNNDSPTCVADILVQDRGADEWTLYAPSARGRGFTATWLHVEDNWLELPTVGWLDVHGFQEPSWSNFGGRVYGQCLQWDGRGWSLTLAGRIVGIDATPGACRIQLVDTSGTYRRDDDCIFVLQPKAQQEQDSWVDRLLGVICDDAGEYATGLLGPTWMGV